LVFGTLFSFGIGAGVGAESISLFFKLIKIDTHVGISPSVLRGKLQKMEELLPQFQDMCEKNQSSSPKDATVALDETFFGKFMILVMMDLKSGYLLLEDVADDRCYDTWFKKTMPRLEQLGITVTHAISDRAKALIKMAVTGFECQSGADLFHAQQDVSRLLGGSLGRRLSAAEKSLEEAKAIELKTAKKHENSKEMVKSEQERIKAEKHLEQIKKSSQKYHDELQGIGDDIHPFTINKNEINNAQMIESSLESRAHVFEEIAAEEEIIDHKGKMKKFRKQFSALAISVTVWWVLVSEILEQIKIEEEQQEWFTKNMLSVVYWHQRMEQTKNPKSRKKYYQAWEEASKNLKNHPLTMQLPINELEYWQNLAENMVRQFHRSSSAVEGRNGCLSQMYHNGRGFTEQRLKALTVVHNYYIKRANGTTAGMRLFGIAHADLFKWLLNNMGDLPLPRNRSQVTLTNSLILLDVPS
jgi:hypothetical protein